MCILNTVLSIVYNLQFTKNLSISHPQPPFLLMRLFQFFSSSFFIPFSIIFFGCGQMKRKGGLIMQAKEKAEKNVTHKL